MTRSTAPRGTQAVTRAILLLEAFTTEEPELGLGQLCDRVGLTKTTAHRLLHALECRGLVCKNSQTNRYRLGPTLISLGSRALLSDDLRSRVRPTLEILARQTGERALLECLIGDRVLVLDSAPTQRRGKLPVESAERIPFHASAAGKAIVAFLEPAVRDLLASETLIRFTDRTLTDRRQLEAQMIQIREDGFAVAVGEYERDRVSVSAPLHDDRGIPSALTISGPRTRFDPRRVRSLAVHLRTVASRLAHCDHIESAC